MQIVIPDLASERSEAGSVGNPCLDIEDARILSATDTRPNGRSLCSHLRSPYPCGLGVGVRHPKLAPVAA
jgi:hypothetical protein